MTDRNEESEPVFLFNASELNRFLYTSSTTSTSAATTTRGRGESDPSLIELLS